MGSVKFIHLDWLKEWLDAKKSEKKGLYFSSYLWEDVFCELWKDNFTENVMTQFGAVNILGIETPKNSNYIILEALNSEEILKKNTKIVHIIDFKKLSTLTVGRGHDNKVRITDISISRLHCKFKVKGKDIYIEDHGSKFGTLVSYKRPLNLNEWEPNTLIQIDRSLLSLSVTKPSKLCCKIIKPTNLVYGLSYINNANTFPGEFKKFCAQFKAKDHRINQSYENKDVISSDNLLNRKSFNNEFHTHDQDRPMESVNQSIMNPNRPSIGNNLQTQTLIVPQNDRNTPNTIQHETDNQERLADPREPVPRPSSVSNERPGFDQVDNRFSSEGSINPVPDKDDLEEVKELHPEEPTPPMTSVKMKSKILDKSSDGIRQNLGQSGIAPILGRRASTGHDPGQAQLNSSKVTDFGKMRDLHSTPDRFNLRCVECGTALQGDEQKFWKSCSKSDLINLEKEESKHEDVEHLIIQDEEYVPEHYRLDAIPSVKSQLNSGEESRRNEENASQGNRPQQNLSMRLENDIVSV